MNVLALKVLGLLAVFGLMLAGVLVPVRLLQVTGDQVHRDPARRYRRPLSLCSCFGGGVFLATCFNALLPAVRDKVSSTCFHLVLHLSSLTWCYTCPPSPGFHLSYITWTPALPDLGGGGAGVSERWCRITPLAETVMVPRFILSVLVEKLVLAFRRSSRPSSARRTPFSGGNSEAGSDSDPSDVAGGLRLLGLVLALSAHSVLEGVALGLQEDAARLSSMLLGVALHETLAAVALGVSVARAALPMRDALKSTQGLAGAVASVVLQGLAAGTFLFVTFLEILPGELQERQDGLLK
ncbi:hypothetical protein CRUP_030717, partial [Coryphaenoides rupestris]